jgi:Protein of unknown function (DUF2953)
LIELFLFLGTFCVLFFLPVQFRIFYQKIDWDDTLILELSFLKGLLKRRRVVSLLQLNPKTKKREKLFGRWFFFRKAKTQPIAPTAPDNSHRLQDFLDRYQRYGLGVTMMTYFLPAKYQHWILVANDLESRGHFTKLTWITRIGTGDPVSTATLSGVLWGVKSSIFSVLCRLLQFDRAPDIQVIPDFQTSRLDLIFESIFRVKLGYIIIAALIARFRYRMLKGGIGVGKSSN